MTGGQEPSGDIMADVLVAGPDEALTEGLAQALAAAGHRVRVVRTILDAVAVAAERAPLVAVLDRRAVAAEPGAAGRLASAPGGGVVLFHALDGAEATPVVSPALRRGIIADLVLPLERHRLVALVNHVAERARLSGRGRESNTPPEQRRAP